MEVFVEEGMEKLGCTRRNAASWRPYSFRRLARDLSLPTFGDQLLFLSIKFLESHQFLAALKLCNLLLCALTTALPYACRIALRPKGLEAPLFQI